MEKPVIVEEEAPVAPVITTGLEQAVDGAHTLVYSSERDSRLATARQGVEEAQNALAA